VRVYQFRHIRADVQCSRAGLRRGPEIVRTMRYLRRVVLLSAAVLLVALPGASALARSGGAPTDLVQVVVTLEQPPLARAATQGRTLASTRARGRVSLRAPASRSYLRTLAGAQRSLQSRIATSFPGARFGWRYSVVANGFSVVLPRAQAERLSSVPGVAKVWPSVRYRPLLDRSVKLVKAPSAWGPGLTTSGQGMKIGIVDDGIDPSHPFLSPARYTMPPGFPKGVVADTTAKVIVARAFAPPSPGWRNASRPFDPLLSEHGTHVAGIAAGNSGTRAIAGRTVSGVAPAAYLGNYKVLTVPTVAGVGLNGNSPEIAAGIEAAVQDGMDVINLSLGEPEIEPSRDLVVRALAGAAAAGVVPVVAAGNDYAEFGGGSITSPGSAASAITVAAVSADARPALADFSSAGPTPVSLQLKPDLSAPGVDILSSVPAREGTWSAFSGTSMAAPHVAGGAALMRQRHPTWTTEQLKSALVQTGTQIEVSGEARPVREGGGLLDLQKADVPQVFASPSSVSFGFVRPGASLARTITLQDAGGGAGPWSVTVDQQRADSAVSIVVPPTVTVPGALPVSLSARPSARQRDLTGFVVLSRGAERRRIPYWLRVVSPALGRKTARPLRRPGLHSATTRGASSRVREYRYPSEVALAGVTGRLAGPERVFRVRLRGPVSNFGVAVVWRAKGVRVEPRIVRAGDENRLLGQTALPVNLNPYLRQFRQPTPAAGAIRPTAGAYDVVFDSPSRGTAGRFRFRFWVADNRPPRLRPSARTVVRGTPLRIRATDAASGVDPRTLAVSVDNVSLQGSLAAGVVSVPTRGLSPGRHRLVLQVSDYQESRNMENATAILPNTATLRTTFVVR
jgi:subtilisin family serine protease